MNLRDRITILTGPNGSGKTMILRMVHALFAQTLWGLSRFPYDQLIATFDSGEKVSISREIASGSNSGRVSALRFLYERPGYRAEDHVINGPNVDRSTLSFPVGAIEDIIPELDQIGPESWRHRGSGETLSLDDVLDLFWEELPFDGLKLKTNVPEWLPRIREQIPVRLIETDRLYARGFRRRSRASRWQSHAAVRDSETIFAVNRYSEQLGDIIRQTLTEYGQLSQRLDRTFPGRVVNEEHPPVSLTSLHLQLSEIEKKRADLVKAGLLAQEGEYWPATSSQDIDETKLGVLSVYVNDAKKKLAVFDEILAKVDLFREIINSRFLGKGLAVSSSGFAVVGAHGNPLPLNLLSSGEQHEIVLFYELLFNVSRNSLILIDEPEISLHVAWQEAFLEDVARVAGISQFDAVVATHSPQIINTHWDLAVELQALNGKRAKASSGAHREQRTA